MKDRLLWQQVSIARAEPYRTIVFWFILCSEARNRVFALDSVGKRMHALLSDNGAPISAARLLALLEP